MKEMIAACDMKNMKYNELDHYWKRIFELEWVSLCEKSKAIAALIVDEEGNVISEGRNKIGENIAC